MTSCIVTPIAVSASAGGHAANVHVTITNLRNSKGVVHACMSPDPQRFTKCEEGDGSYQATMSATEEGMDFDFEDVAPGIYAIALLHDENENGRVDRVLVIPREGFGFSRDAPVHFGPPDFEDAAFEVGAVTVNHTIRMRYLL